MSWNKKQNFYLADFTHRGAVTAATDVWIITDLKSNCQNLNEPLRQTVVCWSAEQNSAALIQTEGVYLCAYLLCTVALVQLFVWLYFCSEISEAHKISLQVQVKPQLQPYPAGREEPFDLGRGPQPRGRRPPTLQFLLSPLPNNHLR